MRKTAGTKRFILALAAAGIFLTAGCGMGAPVVAMDVWTPEPSGPVTAQPASSPEPDATAPEQTAAELSHSAAVAPQEVYRPIIDAYIAAQANGFTSFAPILEDTFLATAESQSPDMAGVGVELVDISLYYAHRDINKDGLAELFIIAADSYGDYIWGVYTIADGVPCSLLQKSGAREEIRLHGNEDGEHVLILGWSHMGEVVDLFYRLPGGAAALVLEEGLYTDWNEAAQNEKYAELENEEIVRYGDHYKGAASLYTTPEELTAISLEEWETIWAGFSAMADDFGDMLSLANYPAGF